MSTTYRNTRGKTMGPRTHPPQEATATAHTNTDTTGNSPNPDTNVISTSIHAPVATTFTASGVSGTLTAAEHINLITSCVMIDQNERIISLLSGLVLDKYDFVPPESKPSPDVAALYRHVESLRFEVPRTGAGTGTGATNVKGKGKSAEQGQTSDVEMEAGPWVGQLCSDHG